MSKKADFYYNVAIESWNHSFKVKAVRDDCFRTRSKTKHQVFEYIEVYNNRQRFYSILGYLSPEAFEVKMPRLVGGFV